MRSSASPVLFGVLALLFSVHSLPVFADEAETDADPCAAYRAARQTLVAKQEKLRSDEQTLALLQRDFDSLSDHAILTRMGKIYVYGLAPVALTADVAHFAYTMRDAPGFALSYPNVVIHALPAIGVLLLPVILEHGSPGMVVAKRIPPERRKELRAEIDELQKTVADYRESIEEANQTILGLEKQNGCQ